ncbi:D-arabinono-1,4-lactone oxidase [Streptomyces sp. ACA25]|uniref:D-arabinono-1,4-lactone oxidase n=1 Tax=Streptomyces sp. ACA25 TaxID=3022596 RepID=UPI002308279E|nr:D-arabinono-1,4-lactone oxidase [Streptomyces sp. ACA25]MDB1089800.1 D-arabinono-1,4-lactone oxidase [Streptomyces sp. ACA25]
MSEQFVNWSGSLRFTPREWSRPETEEEVAAQVRRAAEQGRTVRPVGSGHSSVPLMATEDVLLSQEGMAGLVSHDTSAGRGTVLPGTGLSEAGRLFREAGLAMENLGDVDYQTLAGAIGTGTHGTGTRLRNLSATLVGGRLVTGTGDVLPFGEEAGEDDGRELLRAARVSLGSLGILTSLTLELLPAYELRRLNWCTHIDWVLENFTALAGAYRHMDFYWYPRSDEAQVRTMNDPATEPTVIPPGNRVHADEQGPVHEIIPNSRDLRFDEMEYMLPYDAGMACFREVRKRIKDRHRQQVGWRVLVRTVAPDSAMLSNCNDGPVMTIALLQNNELPYQEYFDDLEPLLREFGGRPHWGKKHTMTAADLRPRYPEWDTFQALRRRLDPQGIFLNEYLRTLLEEEK